jgi:hypothetical protein
MKKSKFVTAALAAAIALSPVAASADTCLPGCAPGHTFGSATPWWIFVCPTGVVTAAVVKNARRHKELTSPEAWTCGFLYFWNEGTGKYGR